MNKSAQDPTRAITDELSTGGYLQRLDHGDIIITDLSDNSEDAAGLVQLTGNEVALLVDSLAAERGAAGMRTGAPAHAGQWQGTKLAGAGRQGHMKRFLYPDNWPALSQACKELAGWRCEECGIAQC